MKKYFLILFLTLSLAFSLTFFIGRSSQASSLGSTYLFLPRMKINESTDMYFLLTPSRTFNTGQRIVKIMFPGSSGDWCKVNETVLTVSGISSSPVDMGEWSIGSSLPGTLTGKCYQNPNGDYIEVEGVGSLTQDTNYGFKIDSNANFKTSVSAGNHLVSIQIVEGILTESTSFEINLVSDDSVIVSAEVSAADTITCTLSTNSVNMGTLFKGGAYSTSSHTMTTDSTTSFYWAVYGAGDGTTSAGLYNSTSTQDLISSEGTGGVVDLISDSEGFGMVLTSSGGTVMPNYASTYPGVFGSISRGMGNSRLILASEDTGPITSMVILGARAGPNALDGNYQETLTYICGSYIGGGEDYSLGFCSFDSNGNSEITYDREEIVTTDVLNSGGKLEIVNITWPDGFYRVGEELTIGLEIDVSVQSDYRISFRYLDPNDNWVIYDTDKMGLGTGLHNFDYTWIVDEDFEKGFYGAAVQIMEMVGDWDVSRRDIIKTAYINPVVYGDWYYFGESELAKVNDSIGGSPLDPNNVVFNGQNVTIALPQNEISGGHFQYPSYSYETSKANTYGSYEARLKIPDNHATLSSFFLYAPESEGNRWEIDIEIFNTSKWGTDDWLVTFVIYNSTHENYEYYHSIAEGVNEYVSDGVVYYHQITLPSSFDPTKDFNNYQINFYPNCISFEINGAIYGQWDDSFNLSTNSKLFLFGGAFYPGWLDQTPAVSTTYYQAEWIRYK